MWQFFRASARSATSMYFLIGVGLIIFFDQSSKFIASKMKLVVINQGISFNFAEHLPHLWLTFLLLAFIACIGFVARDFWRKHLFSAGLFFGAAASNIIDRFFFDGVRDWIALPGLAIKNNLADCTIFVVTLFILLIELRRTHQNKRD